MSEDDAEHGYFLSALASFATRTCYANAGGEQAGLCSCGPGNTLLCCMVEF